MQSFQETSLGFSFSFWSFGHFYAFLFVSFLEMCSEYTAYTTVHCLIDIVLAIINLCNYYWLSTTMLLHGVWFLGHFLWSSFMLILSFLCLQSKCHSRYSADYTCWKV